MEELPRQVPPVHPGLGLRVGQGANFISVRQKPDQDGGWGTLCNPKRFELPLLATHRLRSHLGYEAVPASEFWQFTTTARIRLQLDRISSDRYASSVGVALLDAGNRRVAPLVQSASGRGTPVEIPPGTYTIVASLGIAESLKDLIFELQATPACGLIGALQAQLNGAGSLLQQQSQRRLQALAAAMASGTARLANAGGFLKAAAPLQLLASATLRQPQLQASGSIQLLATAALHPRGVASLAGSSQQQTAASLQIRPVRWLNEPLNFWRARVVGGVLELNRSYLAHGTDPASTALQQQQLSEALNP